MSFYFDDTEKQAELKRILDSWTGTPFKHHTGVKQRGCDCIHFVAKTYEEMGLIILKKVPEYPHDWHMHNTRELLLIGIIKYLDGIAYILEKGDPDLLAGLGAEVSGEEYNPMNGDIILSHYGKASSHAAIYFDDYIYQAVNNVGVCKIQYSDKVFRRQMRFAYRVTA